MSKGKIQKMAVSPNGQLLSMFGADGHVFVVTMDFANVIGDFKTNADQSPSVLAWY